MRSVLVALMMGLVMAMSQWSAAAELPRPEHPRPDFMREAWQNLNGTWDFAFDPEEKGEKEKWFERESLPQKILVPFPIEAELSGIGQRNPPQVGWYLRVFDLTPNLAGAGRLLLHFGAVDYQATVWLNGTKLGEHVGGYSPFSFDVTEVVKEKDNHLVVRVWDSRDRMQVHGKQTRKTFSYGIMYTAVTGIWQTVWLERVGDPYIKAYRFLPAEDLSGGRFFVEVVGKSEGVSLQLQILGPEGKAEPESAITYQGLAATWQCVAPRPWSPAEPNLYQVRLRLVGPENKAVDEVASYIGLRTIKTKEGKVWLNGRPFYQKLLLDQGYFPSGIYTPANDEIMKNDCEMYKRMGFNGLRKHQKLEDPRFLYWCDKLGLVVWEEMPSLGFGLREPIPKWARDRFREEWLSAMNRDFNHPCIITWTLYNENWGIWEMPWRKATRDWAFEMVKLTRQTDPTRLVCDNSGGWHFDTDLFDFHHYLPTVQDARKLYEAFRLKPGDHVSLAKWALNLLTGKLVLPNFYPGVPYQGQPIILSEYGGFGFYATRGDQSLLELYRDYTLAIAEYPQIQGYCYTQPYDVEQEQNGLMTFERKPKVPPEEIRKINDQMGRE